MARNVGIGIYLWEYTRFRSTTITAFPRIYGPYWNQLVIVMTWVFIKAINHTEVGCINYSGEVVFS